MATCIRHTTVNLTWDDMRDWRQVPQPPHVKVRSAGVHLSGINRAVLIAMGELKDKALDEEMPLIVALGMAWENWVVGLEDLNDGKFIWQPGEWEKDGVFGTPDGISRNVLMEKSRVTPSGALKLEPFRADRLEEFKLTTKRPRELITLEKGWMFQLAGNCYALGLEYCRLHVLWVNPGRAQYDRYIIKFTQVELDTYWNNIVLPNKAAAIAEKGTALLNGTRD